MKATITAIVLAATISVAIASSDTLSTDDPSRSTPLDPQYRTAWHEFYYGGSGEGDIDAPLVRVGRPIVPSLCRAVADPNMRRRRYAIGALGWIRDRRAILTLETIYANSNEDPLYRGDALEAIFIIDQNLGRLYARNVLARNYPDQNYLKSRATEIIEHPDRILEPPTE
jgi:hypothetical protein